MIRSLTVINPKGESLKLELRKPETSGLIVQNIEGLGPSKATINATELATMDGVLVTSSKVDKRNIVLTLAMLESPSIEDARQRTYRYFPLKKKVTLRVETDNRIAEIAGYVESNEPVIFSERETTQISIVCPDPFFYESGDAVSVFSGVQPRFEFPFANNSLSEPLIEFGEILVDNRAILTYTGDADTGVVITIHALEAAENITLYNVDTREQFKIYTDKIFNLTEKAFGKGDDIIISTMPGNKYVRLLRDGIYTNIISAIDKYADWFQLSAGDNLFAFTADSGEESLLVTFSYRNAFSGI